MRRTLTWLFGTTAFTARCRFAAGVAGLAALAVGAPEATANATPVVPWNDCYSVPLRVRGFLLPHSATVYEPVQAGGIPCPTETDGPSDVTAGPALLPVGGPLGSILDGVSADTVTLSGMRAETVGSAATAEATTTIARATISLPGLTIVATGLRTSVWVDQRASCSAPVAGGSSEIASLTINGAPVPVGEGAASVPLTIGALRINEAEDPPWGSHTRRALLLDTGQVLIAVGESSIDAGCL